MAPRARREAGGGRGTPGALSLRALVLAAALAGTALAPGAARAGVVSRPYCDVRVPLSAVEQDRLLSFASLAREVLQASGASAAIVSRSGLDLSRFRIRYSHAGVSLAASDHGPWSVRQLYYACDERRPQLFDQGLAGFVQGTEDAQRGFVSIVLLPDTAALPLARAAADGTQALALLGAAYSANAYPYSTRYQNCNQWLAELLALSWGARGPTREAAQAWLGERGYAPAPIEVGSHWLMAAGPFVPWLHTDDHPVDDLYALRIRTSLPSSIEAFVHALWPQARRIELCHDGSRAVLREGWTPIGPDCVPEPGDEVRPLT